MIEPYYSQDGVTIYCGDCREVLPKLDLRADAVVTDPPYELGFMGKSWDASGVAFDPETWRRVLDAAKPGAHLLAFGGSRTFHRIAVAIEDAGWELRDTVLYLYGTGFPKSHDVSKAIDRKLGAVREVVGPVVYAGGHSRVDTQPRNKSGRYNFTMREGCDPEEVATAPATPEATQWIGWGSALKPAFEPIIVARKPLDGTIAENVLKHGCGGLNIDACRINTNDNLNGDGYSGGTPKTMFSGLGRMEPEQFVQPPGRWPANIIHDGSQEVVGMFPCIATKRIEKPSDCNTDGDTSFDCMRGNRPARGYTDSGSAARFYYCAKASKSDRGYGNTHATVKPTELMRYLCKLVTPPGGLILDPFCGSGTTAKAAALDGFQCVGIELHAEHCEIIRRRLDEEYIPPEEEDKPPRPKQQVFTFD